MPKKTVLFMSGSSQVGSSNWRMVGAAAALADGDMADVGAGTTEFAPLLATGSQTGLIHHFVEHDRPADALASIAASFSYLQALRF